MSPPPTDVGERAMGKARSRFGLFLRVAERSNQN